MNQDRHPPDSEAAAAALCALVSDGLRGYRQPVLDDDVPRTAGMPMATIGTILAAEFTEAELGELAALAGVMLARLRVAPETLHEVLVDHCTHDELEHALTTARLKRRHAVTAPAAPGAQREPGDVG